MLAGSVSSFSMVHGYPWDILISRWRNEDSIKTHKIKLSEEMCPYYTINGFVIILYFI